MHLPSLSRGVLATALALAFALQARAQSAFFVAYNNKPAVVRKVEGGRAYVEDDGKLVSTSFLKPALVKVSDYLPVFIKVNVVTAGGSSRGFNGTQTEMNREFPFQAQLTSPVLLNDVFGVLEIEQAGNVKTLFPFAIGRLAPRRSELVDVIVPIQAIGSEKYVLHLFVGGIEALHSLVPPEQRAAALDGMIARRAAGLQDGPPRPFLSPPPEYPPELLKTKAKGEVVVRLHIEPNGAVLNPQIVRTSDPAFGEATVAAVREWRFIPRIKDGKPVESTVAKPLNFAPPAEKSSGAPPPGLGRPTARPI
jgi:TonB family protein